MKLYLLAFIFLYSFNSSFASKDSLLQKHYENAFNEIQEMLCGRQKLSFKTAVFTVENANFGNTLEYKAYIERLHSIVDICELNMSANPLYGKRANTLKNWSVFRFMCDTMRLTNTEYHLPLRYDFSDPFGKSDWTKMFVTKLLLTGQGNCHSLAYLYKIIAEEIGAKAYLSLAPNHIYIKAHDDSIGWYNTELTSGVFPNDAWFSASNYISMDAIRSGIYMDTLSLKQSVALCLYDLAKGYEYKFGIGDGKFVLECLNLCLENFSLCVPAMIVKAETLKKQHDYLKNKKSLHAETVYKEMEITYVKIAKLGYHEMPEKMYLDWLSSIKEAKYQNQNIGQKQK